MHSNNSNSSNQRTGRPEPPKSSPSIWFFLLLALLGALISFTLRPPEIFRFWHPQPRLSP
jgi:hypothetical protein